MSNEKLEQIILETFEENDALITERFSANNIDVANFSDDLTRVLLTGNGLKDAMNSLKKLANNPSNEESDDKAFNKEYGRAYKIVNSAITQVYK